MTAMDTSSLRSPGNGRMPRADRHRQVVALKESGLTFVEIAGRLGLAKSTVTAAYYDPTGEKEHARRHRGDGRCVDCGARTHNCSAIPPERCQSCETTRARTLEARRARSSRRPVWTDQQCFEAIRLAAVDGICTCSLYDSAYVPGHVPSRPALIVRFGSWRNAVHAAGLRTAAENRRREYANRTPDTDLLRPIVELAAKLGHWPGAKDYDEWSPGRGASRATLDQRFGSWMRALELAMESAATASPVAGGDS